MSQLQKEIKCIAKNMEKYITFSVRGLRFIDNFNFLQGSLDSLVSATPKESLKITPTISKGSELLYKKGIYPYEYMDSWGRFSETSNRFFFDGNCWFLASEACYFVVQSGNNFRKPFHPHSRTLALGESHFIGVLVATEALSQDAVEMLNNGLVSMNFSSTSSNKCFVVFHLFGNSAHEFAPGINLQHLRPFQRTALVNLLKGTGDLIRIFRSQGPLCSGWPCRQQSARI